MTCGGEPDLYVGQEGPFVFNVEKQTGETWDPTAITSGTFYAEKSNGAIVSWTAAISAKTSAGLTATYVLGPSDIDVDGAWGVYLSLVGGPSPIRTPTYLKVVGTRFQR